jgi:predicted molibdopterin-dependent oxidoreductase YjgC
MEEALDSAASLIRRTVEAHGATAVGVIGSPHLTNEESFYLARLARESIGTPHLDLVVPLGPADDFLIKAEKAANGRGSRAAGVAPGPGGKDAKAMLAACAAGEIRLLFVVGSGDLRLVLGEEQVDAALGGLEHLIVQDVAHSPLTERASVVLPGLTFAEKDGSFTNHAGRVQRIRKAIEPLEGLLDDGEIFAQLAAFLREGHARGAHFDPRKAFRELASAVPQYAGLELDGLSSLGRPGRETPQAQNVGAGPAASGRARTAPAG